MGKMKHKAQSVLRKMSMKQLNKRKKSLDTAYMKLIAKTNWYKTKKSVPRVSLRAKFKRVMSLHMGTMEAIRYKVKKKRG